MAKDGLGAMGSAFVDTGIAGVQMAGDIGLGMLTGTSALAPMGVRSFGGGALEAQQAGADSDEQMMYGLASALVEVGTEKLSNLTGVFRKAFGRGATDSLVETLIGKLGSTANGRSALRLLAGALGEGAEEVISGVVNPIIQSLYNGQSVKENYSELDISEVAYEGLIGALLGGVGGMVSFPGDVSRERARINAAAIGRNSGPVLQTDTARYSFQEQKIPTYEELIAKPGIPIVDIRDGAEKGTFREQRQAILNSEEMKRLFQEPIKNRDTGELVFVTPATLTHSFHNMGAEQLAAIKHINDIIQNAVLTHAETSRKAPDDHTTGVYTLFAAVRTENGVQPVKVKVKEYYLEGQEVPEPVKLYFAQNGEMNPYASAYDNRVLMLEDIEKEEVSSSAESTVTKVITADNYPSTSSEISISELYELVNSEYAKYLPRKETIEAAAYLERARETLGENGGRALRAAYDEGQDVVSYYAGFAGYYRAGISGLDMEKVDTAYTGALTEAQRAAAYMAGQNDAATSLAQEKEEAQVAETAGQESGLVYDEYVENTLDKGEAEQIDKVTKLLGVRVRFVDEVRGGTANAQISGAETEVEKGNPNPVLYLLGHEWTHRLQAIAPEQYRAFRDSVVAELDGETQALLEGYRRAERAERGAGSGSGLGHSLANWEC